MAFLLALQFFAIALGGWLVLRLFGVRPAEPSIGRGSAPVRALLLTGAVAITAALVFWQIRSEPRMQKADLSRAALETARDALAAVPEAALVDWEARFTRPELHRYRREGMLIRIVAERISPSPAATPAALAGSAAADVASYGGGAAYDAAVEAEIRAQVRTRVAQRLRGVVPFVDVTLLPGPPPNP